MKKVLLISYYFPPLGMGGTQRPAKFAKYLHEFGWHPTVLTVKPVAYFAQDETLLDELAHVRILRTESWDPQRLLARFRCRTKAVSAQPAGSGIGTLINEKLLPFVIGPDSKRLWQAHALHAAKQLLRAEKFDVVYTTSPPHSVQLVGLKLKQIFAVKWVADFRDAWAGGVVVHEPTAWQYQNNLRWQKKVLNAADAVLAVTPGLAEDLRAIDTDSCVHVLTNGFDPHDYPQPRRTDKRFVLCHCGSVTRFSDPDIVLQALAALRQSDPVLAGKLLLQFVGYDALGNLQKQVQKYGLQDMVEILGYKPHRLALEYMVAADVLLLVALGQERDRFIPGKVFEYIGAQKPILAVCNVDDTRKLLQQNRTAIVTLPQVQIVARAVNRLLHNKAETGKDNTDFTRQFERREQTRKLAEIMERL